jgi:hypothetical protein
MLVTSSKFAAAQKNTRVKLLIDQKIQGLSLSAGDVCDVPSDLARRLKNIGRAEVVPSDFAGDDTPKKANR